MDRMRRLFFGPAVFIISICFFGCAISLRPVAWEAPPNPGYTGAFAPNEILKEVEQFSIGENEGPESIAVDNQGRIYASTLKGTIVRLLPDCTHPEAFADTGGRPLGIVFDNQGNLIVADAFRGLLSIDPEGNVTELVTVVDGLPIRYADDVDVADDGRIYFSDASTKFSAKECGSTFDAYVLDAIEHRAHGRLLCYDPETGKAETLLKGIHFANGIAVSHDQQYVLVNETNSYRVLRYWIKGDKKGQSDYIIEELPAFPDNITTGFDGRFWVALPLPRSKILDGLSGWPVLRKIAAGLPKFMQPKPKPYGHIIAIDGQGKVVYNLQDPEADYSMITGVCETKDYLYLGSLTSTKIARLKKSLIGVSK